MSRTNLHVHGLELGIRRFWCAGAVAHVGATVITLVPATTRASSDRLVAPYRERPHNRPAHAGHPGNNNHRTPNT